MIKVQGLGRRRNDMSHDDAIAHHQNIHSQLGMSLDHMDRYILYYFDRAFDADGAPIDDMPWDMSALEWFRDDDYWHNFQQWLASAPDGQEVANDEANFLERERCFMCPYVDEVHSASGRPSSTFTVLRLLAFADTVSAEAGHAFHSSHCVTAIRGQFSDGLCELTVNRITEATSLAFGKIPHKPVDIVEIYTFDAARVGSLENIWSVFSDAPVGPAEAAIFDRSRTINLTAEEVAFLP